MTSTVTPPPSRALTLAPPLDSVATVPRGAPLGSAGITPSAVIKGCWQLSGGHRGDTASDRTSGEAAVADFSAFAAAGIDSFDMGPEACGYGPAEEYVGKYLRLCGSQPLVFTKLCCVGYEQSQPSAAWVRSRVERACSRTVKPAVDLMQLYWNDYSYNKELLSTGLFMMDEKEAGFIRAVGHTNFDTDHLEKLRAAGVEVASHQIQFSLLDRRPLMQQAAWCKESGCKLLPYGVVAGGLLSDAYLGLPADAVTIDTSSKGKYSSVLRRSGGWPWFQRLLATLRSVGDKHGGASIANVATKWVLDHEFVGAVILGARNANHVSDHVAMCSLQLTQADRDAIQAVLDEGVQSKGDTYAWERGGQF